MSCSLEGLHRQHNLYLAKGRPAGRHKQCNSPAIDGGSHRKAHHSGRQPLRDSQTQNQDLEGREAETTRLDRGPSRLASPTDCSYQACLLVWLPPGRQKLGLWPPLEMKGCRRATPTRYCCKGLSPNTAGAMPRSMVIRGFYLYIAASETSEGLQGQPG